MEKFGFEVCAHLGAESLFLAFYTQTYEAKQRACSPKMHLASLVTLQAHTAYPKLKINDNQY